MNTLLRRIALVTAAGLVAYLGFSSFHSSAAERYAARQRHATAACRAFRDQPAHANANVCRYDEFGPLTFKAFHAAEAELDEARDALARHDGASTTRTLLAVSASAREMARRDGRMSTLYTIRLVDRIVDLVEAHGAEIGAGARREILDNARLEAALHPFEVERLTLLWVVAHYDTQRLPDGRRFSVGELADEMDHDEAAFLEMEEATLRGDVTKCEARARTLGPLGHPEFMPGMCAKMSAAVRTRARIERM